MTRFYPSPADAALAWGTMVTVTHSTPLTADGATDAADAVDAVAVAVPIFAARGYHDTKLETVARESGVSKRMLHYHFGDKHGLYLAALGHALALVSPPAEVLERSSDVPVDGMRRFVDALFHTFLNQPEAVRLLLRENLDRAVSKEELASDERGNHVALHVERLLMAGQDAGAFRPGIRADDLLVLIVSLCEFHVAHPATSYAISRIDMGQRRNVEGMRRMVIDAVLTFLTSSIPHSGYDSYLVTDGGYDSAGDIY